jgi:hypothetical protein
VELETRVLTYYDVLGVDPGADLDAIRQAWRVKVRLLHPDRHRGSPDEVQAEAATETVRVNRAWETLRDPDRRRSYDQTLSASNGSRSYTPPTANQIAATCAVCHTTQNVPRTAGRFDCVNCRMAWQFAKCESCNEISPVRERKTTWRCPSCAHDQTSTWGGGSRYVYCTRCKAGTLTAPDVARFSCKQCRLTHLRCDCGQYTPVLGWQWRSWRCPKCKRVNPPGRHSSFDVVQVVMVVIAAFLGIVGLFLVTGLAR